jgi:hypothetical protein
VQFSPAGRKTGKYRVDGIDLQKLVSGVLTNRTSV